jgi:NAD(P)-dependent dehydrogenase (short-subunit alcohol dehydrogenase family)
MSTAQAVAVITGASRGIGAALVQAFRNRNYRIVATSRSIKPCRDEDLVTVQGDVADPNTATLVFKEALDRFGRVDTLVNNAGTFIPKPFISYSNDDYATYIATNVTGFFHMTQRAMELMSQTGRGHVVTVSSSLVDQPMSSVPGVLTSLTKGALNAATRALSIEHAKNGVRVNAVSAGIIKTPMHAPEIHPFFASHGRNIGNRGCNTVSRIGEFRDRRNSSRRWRAVSRSPCDQSLRKAIMTTIIECRSPVTCIVVQAKHCERLRGTGG